MATSRYVVRGARASLRKSFDLDDDLVLLCDAPSVRVFVQQATTCRRLPASSPALLFCITLSSAFSARKKPVSAYSKASAVCVCVCVCHVCGVVDDWSRGPGRDAFARTHLPENNKKIPRLVLKFQNEIYNKQEVYTRGFCSHTRAFLVFAQIPVT